MTLARLRSLNHSVSKHRLAGEAVIWCVHVLLFFASAACAFLLRFDFTIPAAQSANLVRGICVWCVVKLVVFKLFRLQNGCWRFFSVPDLFPIAAANVVSSAASTLIVYLLFGPGFPRSVFALDLLLSFLLTTGARLAARLLWEPPRNETRRGELRVLIYGAGVAGVTLLREIRSSRGLGFQVCGFIDDERGKRGAQIQGVPVLGPGTSLGPLAARHGVELVLIAVPSASGQDLVRILQHCSEAGIRFRTIPALPEIIQGRALAQQIRDVAVEDLLNRTPVELDAASIRRQLAGQAVLVTGGAGSIGAELCRQLARFGPRTVIAFDVAETGLFQLELEMRAAHPGVDFQVEIGNIQSRARLAELFRRHSPSVVYHAAAYKHVPMMEANLFEAIENNILGTRNVALAAAEHGVRDFVMISTDKAVRPTSVMGVTKRVAELLILSLPTSRTRYVTVRFGNVLGSNGSVVPLFKQQIAAGGPLTVTHPEMQRYFMTISEAAQLVLQASALDGDRELFVLEMGEPIRILDLARNLVLLSGLRPGKEIDIIFSGIRPGEKLYEELNSQDERLLPTGHEKIRILSGDGLPVESMNAYLADLSDLTARRDLGRLVLLLKQIVPEYNASGAVLRGIVEPRGATERQQPAAGPLARMPAAREQITRLLPAAAASAGRAG